MRRSLLHCIFRDLYGKNVLPVSGVSYLELNERANDQSKKVSYNFMARFFD